MLSVPGDTSRPLRLGDALRRDVDVGGRFGYLRARLVFVGDAKDGRRGGCLRGLEARSSGEWVLFRLSGGSSITSNMGVQSDGQKWRFGTSWNRPCTKNTRPDVRARRGFAACECDASRVVTLSAFAGAFADLGNAAQNDVGRRWMSVKLYNPHPSHLDMS